MINNIAKCGCDCISCPTYKDNVKTIDNRQKCSSAWEKYLDIKLSPEKLRACDGCSIADSERKTYYLNCKIRKCAMINEIENCAYCNGFPCEEILKSGLRKEGWVFRLKFGGTETLQVFKDYITRLNIKYGNKAFKIFNTADLSIMTN